MAKTDSLTVEEFLTLRQHLTQTVALKAGPYRTEVTDDILRHPAFNARAAHDDMLESQAPAKAVKVEKK